MTNPKRYDMENVSKGWDAVYKMVEGPDGDYVTFEDYKVLRGSLSLAEEGLANATQEIHQLRTALGNLTNGYKYPAEVCEIAREALGTAHEQNATPGAAISSEDSVSYSAESSGPRGLQLQQANLEAGIAKLGEIHNSQEGVIVHGPEATALLAAFTFEPTGQCMDASYRKDTVCELQKGHDGSHVGHEAYSGITHAWRSNEPGVCACIPLAPRPAKYCSDCGKLIPQGASRDASSPSEPRSQAIDVGDLLMAITSLRQKAEDAEVMANHVWDAATTEKSTDQPLHATSSEWPHCEKCRKRMIQVARNTWEYNCEHGAVSVAPEGSQPATVCADPECQHDLQKPNHTINIRGPYEAYCGICKSQWHLTAQRTGE